MKTYLATLLVVGAATFSSVAATTNEMATRPWVSNFVGSVVGNITNRNYEELFYNVSPTTLSLTNRTSFTFAPTNKLYNGFVTTLVGFNTNNVATNEIWMEIGGANGNYKFPLIFNNVSANVTNIINFGCYVTASGAVTWFVPFVKYSNPPYDTTNYAYIKPVPSYLSVNIMSNSVVTNTLVYTNYGTTAFSVVHGQILSK